jgi:hypothetical protein
MRQQLIHEEMNEVFLFFPFHACSMLDLAFSSRTLPTFGAQYLDDLHSSVTRLGEMGLTIHDELKQQVAGLVHCG